MTGAPIAVAGLWKRWRGKGDQEIISYTLLTVNDHPLVSRMHRPGQEKRMLALLDPAEYDEWLERPPTGAFELPRQYPPEVLLDEPSPKPPAARSLALEEMADVLLPAE